MDKITNTRCVVTGLGMISAIGNNVEECFANALAGKTGIDKVASVDTTDCYANLGAEVHCDTLDEIDEAKEVDRVSKLCLKASKEALDDAGLVIDESNAGRVGVVMGSCVGGVVSVENYVTKGEHADDINKMTIASIANHVANMAGAKGVVTNVGNACAASTISIAYACELIRAGVADAFIVGGADAFASVPFSGFLALHALSEQACSPFNHSNGITLGEGSGAIIVESYEHAKKRNAKIYCDVLSAGISSDAHHITAPRPDGLGQMYAIRQAIEKSGIEPKDVAYVNAHGTGTAKNDEAEFLSLHTIFDEANPDLSVSSTKAMVGHCLGAAGAIEAVFAIKALTENKIPPTIGLGIVSPLGNGVANYIDKINAQAKPEATSVHANVGKEDYDKYGLKMAFYRKLDKFSLMQVISGLEALQEAGIEVTEENAEELGMIVGTGDGPLTTVYEFQEHISENGTTAGSAFNFPNTVYNAAGGYLSIKTGMRGYNVTVTNGAQSGMSSLCYAFNEIKQNRGKAMLATGTDENSEVMEKLYAKLGKVAGDVKQAYAGGDGFVLADGSTSIALENETYATSHNAKKYAEVCGYAMTHEGVAYGDVAGTEKGLVNAIVDAAAMAGITLDQIDAVYGFANGADEVDTLERHVYEEIFAGKIPVHQVRDYTGEGRAASSALSVAHAALTLSGDLAARQNAYYVTTEEVTKEVVDTSAYKYVLATSCAIGGSYAAVILKKVV